MYFGGGICLYHSHCKCESHFEIYRIINDLSPEIMKEDTNIMMMQIFVFIQEIYIWGQ